MSEFYSHGKLLLTSEYAVLDGAKALAIPTKFGQSLRITENSSKGLNWKSFNEKNELWFEAEFQNIQGVLTINHTSDPEVAERLIDTLTKAQNLSDSHWDLSGISIETRLEFNRFWGLGSSSTLINNLASWFQIDAFDLLALTFGGSGYDIACAQNPEPITYQLIDRSPEVRGVALDWPFKEQLYFVYLNKKQNSRSGISDYRSKRLLTSDIVEELNRITDGLIISKHLTDFESLVNRHNQLISNLIGKPILSETEFKDFDGCIKNLGAWGGDFILVSSRTDPRSYFKEKGYEVIYTFNEMIL